uniref:Uncharacterized protein n=1 Tax=Rhizophora mucronata TaxID=61149 RepID=A0A2P2Q0G1_RHIMU
MCAKLKILSSSSFVYLC